MELALEEKVHTMLLAGDVLEGESWTRHLEAGLGTAPADVFCITEIPKH